MNAPLRHLETLRAEAQEILVRANLTSAHPESQYLALLADIMTTDVETIDPEADVREAAQILYDNKIGCLPVVEGSRLVGILTEADFVRLMAQGQ